MNHISFTFTAFSVIVSVLLFGLLANVYAYAQEANQQPSSQYSSSSSLPTISPGWTALMNPTPTPNIQQLTPYSPVMAQGEPMYLGYHENGNNNNNNSPATKTSTSTSDTNHSGGSTSGLNHNHKPDSNTTSHRSSSASISHNNPKGKTVHNSDNTDRGRNSFFNANTFLSNIDLT